MMGKTVLSVYEDKAGRLYFRSDLPHSPDGDEEDRLVESLSRAMACGLQGDKKSAVLSAIRQLAFGAVLCASDMELAIKDFRFHLKAIKKASREGRP